MIIYCETSPHKAAVALDDLLLKLKLRDAADILVASLAINNSPYTAPWVPVNLNGPALAAASSSSLVWHWVYDWYAQMCNEHVRRFNCPHKKGSIVTQIIKYADSIPVTEGSIPNTTKYQKTCIIEAYRRHLIFKWDQRAAFWTRTYPPTWHVYNSKIF